MFYCEKYFSALRPVKRNLRLGMSQDRLQALNLSCCLWLDCDDYYFLHRTEGRKEVSESL